MTIEIQLKTVLPRKAFNEREVWVKAQAINASNNSTGVRTGYEIHDRFVKQ